MSNSVTPWTVAHQALPSFTISWSLLKLMSSESVMLSNISSSATPFSSCPQSFPDQGLFQWVSSNILASGGQNIGASVSVFLMNIQGWFRLELTGLISFLSKGFSRVFSSTTVWKHQFFHTQPSLWSNSHNHTWLLGRWQPLLYTFVGKVMSLLFNVLSRFVIAFLPRS